MEPKKLSRKEKQKIQRETGPKINSATLSVNKPLWWPGLLVAALGFLLYANTLGHQYVLDDYSLILENRITQKGLDGIPEIFSNSYRYGYYMASDGLYRPITRMMFAFEWEWGGGKPALGHWMNVLLYALTGWMLFRFLFKWTYGNFLLAFASSLIFIAHPIHTEVVANIKSRDEILAFLFCLWSLDLYLDGLRKHTLWKSASCGLLLFLALGSKESAITFLAIFPLAGWFFSKGSTGSDLIKGLAMPIMASILFLLIRANVLGGINTLGTPSVADNLLMATSDGLERFATAVSIMGLYLQKLVVPHPLVFDYSFNQIPIVSLTSISFLFSFLVYLALFAYAIFAIKKRCLFSFSILFFLVSMSISSNIFMKTGSSFGERFLYAPSLSIAVALGFALVKVFNKSNENAPSSGLALKPMLVLMPILLLFSIKTVARNPVWKDNFTLYSNDVKLSPNSTRTQYYMGNYLVKKEAWQGKTQSEKVKTLREAIAYLKRSVTIYDKFSDAHLQMGVAYYNLGLNDSALVCYEKALAIAPRNHTIMNNIGTIYFIKNEFNKALPLFQKAVEIDPNYADGQSNLGSTYGVLQQYDKALTHLLKAASLDPSNAQIQNSLGTTYKFKGDEKNASIHFEQAYRLNPALKQGS